MTRLLLVVGTAAATLALAAPANAAVVSFDADGLQYRAAPQEANRVDMQTGLQPFYPFFEYGATLIAGPGCTGTQPVVCGDGQTFAEPQVSLGDRDDVAFVDSFFGSPSVFGEAGDDDIWSGGGVETFAYGGPGDDTLRTNTDGGGTGLGGPGDDRIAGTATSVQDNFQGESGNDLLVASGFSARLTGGSGRDALVLLGNGQASGDSGADVIVAPARGTLSGGSGTDIVKGHGTVDAGSGSDLVDVTDGQEGMEPDTVTCGSGHDVVWASADDVVAADCDVVHRSAAPALPAVTAALEAADALLAHRPDPAQP